jgi:hypothetical protein
MICNTNLGSIQESFQDIVVKNIFYGYGNNPDHNLEGIYEHF